MENLLALIKIKWHVCQLLKDLLQKLLFQEVQEDMEFINKELLIWL